MNFSDIKLSMMASTNSFYPTLIIFIQHSFTPYFSPIYPHPTAVALCPPLLSQPSSLRANGPASPETPSIYGAGKNHVSLVRRKVEVGVVGLLQPGAPVVNLISTQRLAFLLLLLVFLCSLLQHFGCEQSSCHCIHLQNSIHPPMLITVACKTFLLMFSMN